MQDDSPASFQSLPEGPLRLIASKLSLRGKLALSLVCSDARRILVADPDPGCMGKLHVIVDPPNIDWARLYGPDFKPRTIYIPPKDSRAPLVIRLSAGAHRDTRSAVIQFIRRRLSSFASAILEVCDIANCSGSGSETHLTPVETVRAYRAVFPVWDELCEGLSGLTLPPHRVSETLTLRHHIGTAARDRSFLAPFLEPLTRLQGLKIGVDLWFDAAIVNHYFHFEAKALSLLQNLTHLDHVSIASNIELLRPLTALSALPSLRLRPSDVRSGGTVFDDFSVLRQLTGLKSLDLLDVYLRDWPLKRISVADSIAPLTAPTRVAFQINVSDGNPEPDCFLPIFRIFPNATSLHIEIAKDEFGFYDPFPYQLPPFPERITDVTFAFYVPCDISLESRVDECGFTRFPAAVESLQHVTSLSLSCIFHQESWDQGAGPWLDVGHAFRDPDQVDGPVYHVPRPRIRFNPGPDLSSLTNLKSLRFETAFRRLKSESELRHLPDVGFVLPAGFSALTALTSLRADGLSDFIDQDLPPQMRGEGKVRMRQKRVEFARESLSMWVPRYPSKPPWADPMLLVNGGKVWWPTQESFVFGPD